ncbi:efflux RND transporter permease subunit [Lacibacter sp. H407]|uniref:efflux RND transporter permease subunit n=1 Tax=Lacibacter sp. H407 TaxID=3133423 RepID=UPI0030BBEB8F
MWYNLGKWVLRNRLPLIIAVLLSTAVMTYFASKVERSYDFAKAIPVDHPKFLEYEAFKQKFGEDGSLLVIGFEKKEMFQLPFFQTFVELQQQIKKVAGVEDVLSFSAAVNLVKDSATEKLRTSTVFPENIQTQTELDSCKDVLLNLPFYKGLFYNYDAGVYMLAVRLNREVLNSKKRQSSVDAIVKLVRQFEAKQKLEMHLSGLPHVRTEMSTRIAAEMQFFLLGSVLLSALILLVFFRSFSAMWLSMVVVIIGVIWSLATMVFFGYKITILNALIPPLMVVIGIPNCVYFLNKFHTEFKKTGDKHLSLVNMMGRMGIVTLFCNIAAAIGFAVFALTKSQILREFGIVAGINIMVLFVISFILIPIVLSYLPAPKQRHVRYLENERLNRSIIRIENWVFNHPKYIYTATTIIVIVSLMGVLRLKSVGYIVDDLPKNDKLYVDLKFFEQHFSGVMPLEIVVDTKRKQGVTRSIPNLTKIDSLVYYLEGRPEIGKALAVTEGLKFARQAYYDNDSNMYAVPNEFDLAFLAPYLRMKADSNSKNNNFVKLVANFVDSTQQKARISVNMADVGSDSLPKILAAVQQKAEELFNNDSIEYATLLNSGKIATADIDSSKLQRSANIQLTGTSIIFVEGSRFIINGLKESIFWAFLLIALCMLYLFRSARILFCSLIPNIVPLVITAGVMGWVGIPLKPSTVLVFSVALGIAIDVTIRFLINYKQELPLHKHDVQETVKQTIRQTGISIIYTSLVLVAGFIIFCLSDFGGTQALGWLTSLTLLVAMITNLVLLPVLLITTSKKQTKK